MSNSTFSCTKNSVAELQYRKSSRKVSTNLDSLLLTLVKDSEANLGLKLSSLVRSAQETVKRDNILLENYLLMSPKKVLSMEIGGE